MNKKGIEITFNWIFVLVAGSILLLFFIYFGWKQVGLFNEIGVNEVVDNINNEIDAFSIGVSSSKVVSLPGDIAFRFRCGDVIFKDKKKDTLNLIYGGGYFKDKFNLWSRAWIFPFKIDNIYYVSDINKKFYIIGNDNLVFNMPDNFKKFNKIDNNVGEDDVIIDFTNSRLFNTYKENKVINVDKANNMVSFYPEKEKEEFYGDDMLIGAMFTDFNDYKCLKQKALTRLGIIAELYKKKSDLLKVNSKCGFQYDQIKNTLELFKRDPIRKRVNLIEQNDQIKRDGCAGLF